ncbi:cofactor-independent phosphoglycerate mutase [Candidatus Azobacteroides pseudotrichonymphae]|uniref:Phosphoglycerate mutase n=1 Tax=Azobacteroides pseudotrichonymphae genomovar. CFP2 TaxID=511995 RepID=B6YRU9_AZOPC|nr:cofactor-independent phosphoglycerate mutase [Candidatus Azobacteroides pseudotrichonymphae]BAG83921.1 phosphoglycerate mutase [Candidatus Azobacteroides pseudotrichonymphae genomovar. CFP2]
MKSIIIIGDGMADEPIDILGGKTPLQYAHTPYMDKMAKQGITGRLQTIPKGFHPGSEIANLSILGYNLSQIYEGRGVLEAASMSITLQPNELAMRCNLICIDNNLIKNHSSGHIDTKEADILIRFLNKKLGSKQIKFYTGVSYRHLLLIKGGNKYLKCTPPHDVPLHPFHSLMVEAMVPEAEETATLINNMILHSQKLLKNHPINQQREIVSKDPANSIWPWSPGYRPVMKTMQEMYGFKKGAVISAVDLIHGIGIYSGLKNIFVKGATGLYNTNYEGKAKAAIEALKTNDFVYLHVEASDEAGHEGNVMLKVKTIEDIDNRIVRPIYETLQQYDNLTAIGILPDHPTPCAIRTHTNKPVPFLIYKRGNQPDSVEKFDEFSVENGAFGILEGNSFIKELFKA